MSPELAALVDATRGWQDTSPRAQRQREQSRQRMRELRLRRARAAWTPDRSITAIAEDITWMIDTGETWDGICRRLGIRPDTLERRLQRAGRSDLTARARAACDPDEPRAPRRVA